jgi:ATP-dependent protease ClpP protease subunit
MSEQALIPMLQPNKLFITENRDHTIFEYYLLGEIGNPDEYIDLCNTLRSARPEDTFILRLNSGGGQVRSGNQIINALQECEATTVGFIEHDCGSMCTFIFLACRRWGVSKYAEWFSHTVSGGNYGKECETFEASQFLRRQTHKRIKEEYHAFLTEEEIDKILTGTDIYLDADEIMDRLETYSEYRETLAEQCDCEECQQGEPFNIMDAVEERVEAGIQKALDKILKKHDLVEKVKPVRKPATKSVDKAPKQDDTVATDDK